MDGISKLSLLFDANVIYFFSNQATLEWFHFLMHWTKNCISYQYGQTLVWTSQKSKNDVTFSYLLDASVRVIDVSSAHIVVLSQKVIFGWRQIPSSNLNDWLIPRILYIRTWVDRLPRFLCTRTRPITTIWWRSTEVLNYI